MLQSQNIKCFNTFLIDSGTPIQTLHYILSNIISYCLGGM